MVVETLGNFYTSQRYLTYIFFFPRPKFGHGFLATYLPLTLKSPGFLVPSKDRGGEDSAHNGFWPITVSISTQINQTWFQMKADIFIYL